MMALAHTLTSYATVQRKKPHGKISRGAGERPGVRYMQFWIFLIHLDVQLAACSHARGTLCMLAYRVYDILHCKVVIRTAAPPCTWPLMK